MVEISLDGKVEAILFLLGEPVKIDELAKILKEKKDKILEAIIFLERKLEGRGLDLVRKDEKIMLSTAIGAAETTKQIIKEKYEEELTKSMLEVLAVILYKGGASPAYGGVNKTEIDFIRGVNSVFTLRNLLIRGLVERIVFTPLETSPQKNSSKCISGENDEKEFLMGSKKIRGFFYRPSFQLLQFLGVKNLEELPQFSHFKQKMEKFLQDEKRT